MIAIGIVSVVSFSFFSDEIGCCCGFCGWSVLMVLMYSNDDDDDDSQAWEGPDFASWLIESFGAEKLKEGSGVLDIAGGKGKLSIELAVQANITSTIVDPLVSMARNWLPGKPSVYENWGPHIQI
jgi:hypothetical protein